MAFVEDFTEFFKFADFAVIATLASLSVTGVFDLAYQLGDVGGLGMASTAPVFTLPTASVPANPVGLAMVVSAVSYTVAAHEPDGTGVSLLILERVS